MKTKTFTCELCGQEHPLSQRIPFDDQDLCAICFQLETVVCSYCGERIWREDSVSDADGPLCEHCCENHYVRCDRCGTLLHMDAAHYEDDDMDIPYCSDCFHRINRTRQGRAIQDYYYKPLPVFYGDGPRYFGVELEIDEGGEDSDSARAILEIANRNEERAYCKHDGSLEDGFEIVTHPMSLEYHQSEMPWADILREAVSMGYRSHQSGTCGLHVHVSRDAFGFLPSEQDAVIARVLYFFEKHWEELLKFSRRTSGQLDQWAARYGYKDQPREILDHAKHESGNRRYACVNLQNSATIEFRIFRGTLKLNTLIATLQLVDQICNVALFLSDDEVKAMSWTTFAAGCHAPELVQYLKERRLYVNEPVAMEEEV